MQVPSNLQGLRSQLRNLGYGDVVTGLDPLDPEAKEHCRQQIQWAFEQTAMTSQDDERRRKAVSCIERYQWPEPALEEDSEGCGCSGLATTLNALEDLSALLEEEQVLQPIEVEEYEEDSEGDVQSIVVTRANATARDRIIDALRAAAEAFGAQ